MKDETKKKLGELEREISSEKGDFALWALFLRPDAQDQDEWDLVVSASWLDTNKKQGFKYLAEKVSSKLDTDELHSISRIVLLDKGNPVLEAIQKAVKVKHGEFNVENTSFSGVNIAQACISTSSTVIQTLK